MSIASNKQIVSDFFKHLNAGNVAAAFEKVADEVKWWVPGALPFSGTKNKAGYMGIVNKIQTGFPAGLKFAVNTLVAEGDHVAAEVESLGQHLSGKTYNNKYHFLFTLLEGKVIAVKEYMDTQHLKDLIS